MQCMAHDFRLMCRWRRVDPGDGDEHGDAVPQYVKEKDILRLGFIPQTQVLGAGDNRFDQGTVIQKAFLPYRHDLQTGDRLGPHDADAPTLDVYSVADYPTGQNLEVRPL